MNNRLLRSSDIVSYYLEFVHSMPDDAFDRFKNKLRAIFFSSVQTKAFSAAAFEEARTQLFAENIEFKNEYTQWRALHAEDPKLDVKSIRYIQSHPAFNQQQYMRLLQEKLDQAVLCALQEESRFQSGYPQLADIMTAIFSAQTPNAQQALPERLSAIHTKDWEALPKPEWDKWNMTYGYFNSATPYQETRLLSLYKRLTEACRTIVVLFEQNNTQHETMAYEYAYKLMALFIDLAHMPENEQDLFNHISSQTHKLLRQSQDKLKPFHDALLVSLTLPKAQSFSDKKGWRTLVKKEGMRLFRFFDVAGKIEARLGKAPTNLKDTKRIADECAYTNANKDPEFARLCRYYKVPESRFNECLAYLTSGWPKKQHDNIPNELIQGQTDESNRYFWVKVPPTDKRALILGDITYCCQSIGGDSEDCVKDAVTRSDNGLYVLLKIRKPTDASCIQNGEINDKDYKIIGQSYVWRTLSGNLCLDSIECLNDEISIDSLRDILFLFATKVLHHYQEMTYVTIGIGGKTPPDLFPQTPIAESMRQGKPYEDATKQYDIAHQPNLFSKEDHQALDTVFAHQKPVFKQVINYLLPYFSRTKAPNDIIQDISDLLTTYPSVADTLTQNNAFMCLLSMTSSPKVSDFIPIHLEELEALPPKELEQKSSALSVAPLLWRCESQESLLRIINLFPKQKCKDMLHLRSTKGENILHMSYSNPELITFLLDLYTDDTSFLEAICEKDNLGYPLIYLLAGNPILFNAVFEKIPPSKRQDILLHIRETDYGVSILSECAAQNNTCFETALSAFSKEQRPYILIEDRNELGGTTLHASTCNVDCFKTALEIFSVSQRPDLLLNTKNKSGISVLHESAARSLEVFQTALNVFLQSEHERLLLNVKTDEGTTLLDVCAQSPENLKFALAAVSLDHQLEFLQKMNKPYAMLLVLDNIKHAYQLEDEILAPFITLIKKLNNESIWENDKRKHIVTTIVSFYEDQKSHHTNRL